jgi:hypothetical protein
MGNLKTCICVTYARLNRSSWACNHKHRAKGSQQLFLYTIGVEVACTWIWRAMHQVYYKITPPRLLSQKWCLDSEMKRDIFIIGSRSPWPSLENKLYNFTAARENFIVWPQVCGYMHYFLDSSWRKIECSGNIYNIETGCFFLYIVYHILKFIFVYVSIILDQN